MMNILDKIVAYKREEVFAAKRARPEASLERAPLFTRQTYPLTGFLKDATRTGIIAEFKRRSPSKGLINGHSPVAHVTGGYAVSGASAISVLTDAPSFGGSLEDLVAARAVSVPLLRKEFIIDPYQVMEAKANGADVILLIAAILTTTEVRALAAFAHSFGLQVILEVHDEAELGHICDPVDVVGINNRNLKTFTVDLAQSARLASMISGKPLISESGIYTVDDIRYLEDLGFDGFLIGEAFMREQDPAAAFALFAAGLKKGSK
jgi:indole-3-glycerol phosphate synthase